MQPRNAVKNSLDMADKGKASNSKAGEQKEEKVENGNGTAEEQEETMHTLPPSVLDATLERLGARLTRLCIVARLMTPHAKDKVGLHQSELIEKARVDVEGNRLPVQGLAIVQSHSFINIIEADPDLILRYLNLLKEDLSEEELPWAMEDVRIVSHVEDCPASQFLDWAYRVVALPKETDIDLETENVTNAATSVMILLCKVGADLLARKSDKGLMDKLADNYADSLPSNERVLAFTEQDSIFSLSDYLDFFDSPIKVTLASEKVWPLSERMPY